MDTASMDVPLIWGPIVQRMHRSRHAPVSSILHFEARARDVAHLQGKEVHFSERMQQEQVRSRQ